MLDRAGDADRDIDFRSDDLAGLADLIVVGDIARINRSARSTDAGAELVGERGDDFLELFAGAQGATTGDDDLGAGQFGAFGLGDFLADETGQSGFACAGYAFDRAVAAFGRGLVKGGAAHGDDLLGVR